MVRLVKAVETTEITQELVEPGELAVQEVLAELAVTAVILDKLVVLDKAVRQETQERRVIPVQTELAVTVTVERLVKAVQVVAVVPEEELLDIT